MPKCARLIAKVDAYVYLFGMLSRPSFDRSFVCHTSVFEKYYATWKEYTCGTLISGGNFWKFQKFPDTNILWNFSEVPKTSCSYILTKWKFSEVPIISFVCFCMPKVPKYVDYYFFMRIDEVEIIESSYTVFVETIVCSIYLQ